MDKFVIKRPREEDSTEVKKAKEVRPCGHERVTWHDWLQEVIAGVPPVLSLEASWRSALGPEFSKPYFKKVAHGAVLMLAVL